MREYLRAVFTCGSIVGGGQLTVCVRCSRVSILLEGVEGYTRFIPRRVLTLLAALCIVSALAGCSDDDPNKPSAQPVLDVGLNSCLFVTGDVKATVSALPVIDCAKPHTHQIFATAESKEDVYPGMAKLEEFAQTECYGKFEDFVGIGPFDSALFITWIVPSLDGWNSSKKDREVLCVLGRRDSGQLTGTAEGSKL